MTLLGVGITYVPLQSVRLFKAMGKVKKSVKKFAAKGPDAAKKAVRTHKLEAAKRLKVKAAQEHKAQAGTGKKKKRHEDGSDDEEEGVAAPSLEGMNVDAFMEGLGASCDEEEEEDDESGSEGEAEEGGEEGEDDEEEGSEDGSVAAEESDEEGDAAESDEEVADMKGALKKHKVCPPPLAANASSFIISKRSDQRTKNVIVLP